MLCTEGADGLMCTRVPGALVLEGKKGRTKKTDVG